MIIPPSTGQISAEWLTDVLRRDGCLVAPARVASVVHRPIEGVTGLLGEIARLHLTYCDGAPRGAPSSLIAKGPALAPVNRAMAMSVRCYEHEVRFYREVAPGLAVRGPRCLAAEFEPHSGDFVLLLEDLADLEVGDQVAGANLGQARVAVERLADLHAAWWDSPELAAGGRLGWIPTLDSEITMGRCPTLRACWEPFVAAYGDRLGDAGLAVGDWFQQHCDEVYRNAAAGPLTVADGDFRLDNLFFDPVTPGRTNGFAMVDWQLVVAANGVLDLCYFLCGSLPIDLRRCHEDELVNRYVDRLADRGVVVDRGEVWERYRLFSVANLAFAIAAGGGVDVGDRRGRMLVDSYVDRFFAAASDHWATVAD